MNAKICILAFAIFIFAGQALAQEKGSDVKTSICDNLLRTGQYGAALQCYLQALEGNETNALLNLRICQILEAQGKADQMEPYFAKLDKSNPDAAAFIQMLSQNYAPLDIVCKGEISCPFYFVGRTSITFTAPEEFESPKAKRLAFINDGLKDGKLWFQRNDRGEASSRISYFPIVTGAPLPYSSEIAGKTGEFDFNFISRANVEIVSTDLANILCGVPDTMVELQVEIDDPDYEASFKPMPNSAQMLIQSGRYYTSQGRMSALEYQKKGRSAINKKYLIITSVVLTSIMVFLQR